MFYHAKFQDPAWKYASDSEQLTVAHGRQNDTANENIKTHDGKVAEKDSMCIKARSSDCHKLLEWCSDIAHDPLLITLAVSPSKSPTRPVAEVISPELWPPELQFDHT